MLSPGVLGQAVVVMWLLHAGVWLGLARLQPRAEASCHHDNRQSRPTDYTGKHIRLCKQTAVGMMVTSTSQELSHSHAYSLSTTWACLDIQYNCPIGI